MKSLTKLLFISLLFVGIVHAEEYSVYNTTSQQPQPMPNNGSFNAPSNGSVFNQPAVSQQPFIGPQQSPAGGITPTVPRDWSDKWVNKEK